MISLLREAIVDLGCENYFYISNPRQKKTILLLECTNLFWDMIFGNFSLSQI